MNIPETRAALSTRHRTKTNKTKNEHPRDTGNIEHRTERRETKQRMNIPETRATLSTRHGTKTNKTKNEHLRDTGNIEHKTQNEDKQNKE